MSYEISPQKPNEPVSLVLHQMSEGTLAGDEAYRRLKCLFTEVELAASNRRCRNILDSKTRFGR